MAGIGKENQLVYSSYYSLSNEGRLREKNRRKKIMEERQEYGSNQARIKDLCPDDKARIKQLVEDLARLGTEKEQIEFDWKQERNDLEGKLSLLRKRQALLLKEKSALEENLKDTQKSLKATKKNKKDSSTSPLLQRVPGRTLIIPNNNEATNLCYSTPGYIQCQPSYTQQWTVPSTTLPPKIPHQPHINNQCYPPPVDHPHFQPQSIPFPSSLHAYHSTGHFNQLYDHHQPPTAPAANISQTHHVLPDAHHHLPATQNPINTYMPLSHHHSYPSHPASHPTTNQASNLHPSLQPSHPSSNPIPSLPVSLSVSLSSFPTSLSSQSSERSQVPTPLPLHPQANSTSILNSDTWCSLQEADPPPNNLLSQLNETPRRDVSIQTVNHLETEDPSRSVERICNEKDEEEVLSILLNSETLATSLILMAEGGRGERREEIMSPSCPSLPSLSSASYSRNEDIFTGSNDESDRDLIEDLFYM